MSSDWKPRTGQKIEKLYAWICTEPDGGQGIPAIKLGDMAFPLVGADLKRVESLRDAAENCRAVTGYPVELVEFTEKKVLEALK